MARPRNQVPSFLKHPTRNEARCWVGGRWITLGRWGTDAARREYERVCAVVRQGGPDLADPKHRVSVAEVVLAFMNFALTHYQDHEGKPTSEVRLYRDASKPLMELYGPTPAAEFGPLALQAVRHTMISKDWSRRYINTQVTRLRRLFKWAAAQEMVPPSVPAALACLQGLQKGRCAAKELAPVRPVPGKVIDALLPKLVPTLRAMVELQRYTGMRPGEVRLLRPCDVDRTGDVWLYRPLHHKTEHHGHGRVIPLGPRARAVLEPWLAATPPDATCFSPKRAKDERYAMLRAKRKSKVPPCQANRRKPADQLINVTRDTFTDDSYSGMVRRAAERAGLQAFHPHQLRHSFATEVRHRFGLEAAQVLLGHSKADVTQVYAERNESLAVKVASEIG